MTILIRDMPCLISFRIEIEKAQAKKKQSCQQQQGSRQAQGWQGHDCGAGRVFEEEDHGDIEGDRPNPDVIDNQLRKR
jgi:hypothetical protein